MVVMPIGCASRFLHFLPSPSPTRVELTSFLSFSPFFVPFLCIALLPASSAPPVEILGWSARVWSHYDLAGPGYIVRPRLTLPLFPFRCSPSLPRRCKSASSSSPLRSFPLRFTGRVALSSLESRLPPRPAGSPRSGSRSSSSPPTLSPLSSKVSVEDWQVQLQRMEQKASSTSDRSASSFSSLPEPS
jgi:hypothetical protein